MLGVNRRHTRRRLALLVAGLATLSCGSPEPDPEPRKEPEPLEAPRPPSRGMVRRDIGGMSIALPDWRVASEFLDPDAGLIKLEDPKGRGRLLRLDWNLGAVADSKQALSAFAAVAGVPLVETTEARMAPGTVPVYSPFSMMTSPLTMVAT